MAVLLETTLGDLVIDLFTEERPKACLNFLKLCKIKYYNYCLIHNVQRDFIVQTGDPTGTGRGGESVFSKLYGDQARFFDAEKTPRIKHKKKGTVSMVNNGSGQHGSQFLITSGENLDYLDGVHTVFGEVTEGLDVLAKINETFVDKDFVPFQDIRINHTVVLDDPFDDPAGLPVPNRSPEPTKEQLDSGRIGADEVIDEDNGKAAEELEERLKEKEAKTQAILLEMVGDLPDADIKPPENVLFVCKLNPVTTDEDLEIIFSRFGTIKSCEIIRDFKTGDSLCYAFIEFERQEDCEKAYFKMDNVLIDDRRIHVDFSQSVAKIQWKGKGGKYTKDDFKAYEKELENRSKLALKNQPRHEYPSFLSLFMLLHILLNCKFDLTFLTVQSMSCCWMRMRKAQAMPNENKNTIALTRRARSPNDSERMVTETEGIDSAPDLAPETNAITIATATRPNIPKNTTGDTADKSSQQQQKYPNVFRFSYW